MRHEELTHKIIGTCLDVLRELGVGFTESVYHRALLVALAEAGLKAESEVKMEVLFRGQVVGNFLADVVVEETVILELKSVASCRNTRRRRSTT